MRYAISDIHGCCRTFRYLVEEEIKLQPEDQLFLLGDYIDRGPDSKGVIDFILELKAGGYQVTTLSGNHESMMLSALEDDRDISFWDRNGGKETLKSFGVKDIKQIPEQYWGFINHLDYYAELDDYLLVHAGFNFINGQPFQDFEAMLWIRDFTVDSQLLGDKKIVHGHTPISKAITKNSISNGKKVINIDGGCVYKPSLLGHLNALNLDTLRLHSVRNRE